MKHDNFDHFLDHQALPEDPTQREMALLFQEVSELEIPDPGQEYWNQFNHRLQSKIQHTPKRSSWRWLRPALAFGFSVLVFAVFWPKVQPAKLDPSLASLDSEYLEIIGEMYNGDFWVSDDSGIADSEMMQLLETTETLYEDPYAGWDSFEDEDWGLDEG